MNKKSKNRKQYLKAGGVLSVFAIGAIIAMLMLHSATETIVVQNIESRTWVQEALGADIGLGGSCVVNVSIVKHGLYDYTSNITRNNSMFAWGETNDTEIGANVPYGIKCDIVVKVTWNRTHMYNTTSSNWTWEWVNATIALTLCGYTAGYPGGGGHGHNLSSEWNISEALWSSTNDRTWAHYVYGGGMHSGTGGAAAAGENNAGFSINRTQRCPTVYFRYFAFY